MSIQYLDPKREIAVLTKSGAMVTASSYSPNSDDQYPPQDTANWKNAQSIGTLHKQKITIAPWGKNNWYPLWLLELLSESNINAQLIQKKVSFAMGHVYTFKWEYDPATGFPRKVPFDPGPDIRRWLNSRQIKQLLRARATDFFILGNTWAKPILFRDATMGIASWEHVDACSVRVGLKNKDSKQVDAFYVCSDWTKPNNKTKDENRNVRRYPAFSEETPRRYRQSLLHSRMYWTGAPYYGIQPWHFSYNWMQYSNKMPVWMSANINRSFNIKYHIKYPDGYFDYLNEMFEEEKDRKTEREAIFKKIEEALVGPENAQKAFWTSFKTDPMSGKALEGWSIEPIRNELKDDAFLKAFYAANIAAVSSHGIDPALASIQFEGRMPPSGSDKRISYQLHEVLNNDEVREVMVHPLEITRDVNGWDPEMQFGFMVRNIVTLAEDESGLTAPQLPPTNPE